MNKTLLAFLTLTVVLFTQVLYKHASANNNPKRESSKKEINQGNDEKDRGYNIEEPQEESQEDSPVNSNKRDQIKKELGSDSNK